MHLTYPFLGSPGRTSWTAVLDAVRLGPDDDVAEVTAGQVRALVQRLIAAGQWHGGDPDVLVVFRLRLRPGPVGVPVQRSSS